MGKPTPTYNYLFLFAKELEIMDLVLAEGPQRLRFAERRHATTARHRFYRARLGDRARCVVDGQSSSPYDQVSIKAPVLSEDGLAWTLTLEIVKDIEGLLAMEAK